MRRPTHPPECGRLRSIGPIAEFENWLTQEFSMTTRTARRFMQAATWAEGKSDTVSVWTPTTIYLLSAPSTPEGIYEKVVERTKKGLPAEPEYIRHVIQETKIREREAKSKKRETQAEKKRREARWERESRQEEEESERSKALGREVADFLINKLSDDEIDQVFEAFENWSATIALRNEIEIARQSHRDNVTAFPPKPWDSKR